MYTKQTNSIAIRSQQMLSDAMLQLLLTQSFREISITQLCILADIGRKTFYRHFETKEDVIDYQIDALVSQYLEETTMIPIDQRIWHHYEFLKRHLDYIILLHKNQLLDRLTKKLSMIMANEIPVSSPEPVEQAYLHVQIVASLEAIFGLWAERGFQESTEDVVRLTRRLLDR